MIRKLVHTFSFACLLFGFAAVKAQAPVPSGPLDDAARLAIVQQASKALEDGYVFPDVGERAVVAIKGALKDGSYGALIDPQAFAERLTADLQTVAHDKHLLVFPPMRPGPAPVAGAGPPPPRDEGGVVRADRLPGNIGYIDIVSFPPIDYFRPAIDRAMAALANTKALIIDARSHGGGSPDAEAYLDSYFLPKGAAPVVADRFVWRNRGTQTYRTENFPTSPTPFSYTGKRVYVLTSPRTFSGGEALAYGMRAMRLGKTVGETTGGGANAGSTIPIGSDFAMFLPQGRSNNPITGTNWEGVGVAPDIACPAPDALKVALEHLGQKPGTNDIETLSQQRLFTPRAIAQPGSEVAVRRMIGELRGGAPNYQLLSDTMATLTRQQLPELQSMFTRLGDIETVTFIDVGSWGDVYDVKLANGSVRFSIALSPDGKTVGAGIGPVPLK